MAARISPLRRMRRASPRTGSTSRTRSPSLTGRGLSGGLGITSTLGRTRTLPSATLTYRGQGISSSAHPGPRSSRATLGTTPSDALLVCASGADRSDSRSDRRRESAGGHPITVDFDFSRLARRAWADRPRVPMYSEYPNPFRVPRARDGARRGRRGVLGLARLFYIALVVA